MLLLASACSNEPEEVIYEADYPWYESADELWEASDVVVEVVVREHPVVDRLDRWLGDSLDEGRDDFDVYTVFQLEVVTLWKHEGTAESELTVKQLGGEYEGAHYRESHQESLVPGGRYLLFLLTFPDFPGVPASLVNPDQGQFTLDELEEPRPVGRNTIQLTRSDLVEFSGS